MRKKTMNKLTKIMLLATLLFSASVFAAPKVTLNMTAEKEVTVEENGKMVQKRVVAETVEPGDEVIYTLSYSNAGDEVAKNVKMNNKIPENTSYLIDSAWGENSAIQFSIDAGKTFKDPSVLVYEITDGDGKKIKRKVTPDKYTDILWVVKEIPAGKSGTVGFKIKVN